MGKNIADYLPYYIGQYCMIGDYKGKIQSVGSEETDFTCVVSGTNQDEESGFFGEDEENDVKAEWIKPILRPLSSMTDDKKKEMMKQRHKYDSGFEWSNQITDMAYRMDWCIKQGFDLFGLIEAGLAVDKTKEVTNATN